MCQAIASFLGKCNYILRKFQILASPPAPSVKTFANPLANFLHFTFEQWILGRFFFFTRLTLPVPFHTARLSWFQPTMRGLYYHFMQSLGHFPFTQIMMVSTPFLDPRSASRQLRIKPLDLPIIPSLTTLVLATSHPL